jgi:AraC-like DNA-binding protein
MKMLRLHRNLFKQLVSELEKVKVSPYELLAKSGLAGVFEQGREQPIFKGPDSLVLLETATELTGDPGLALHMGQAINIDSYGTLGFALMTCANMRESIALLLRYGKIFEAPLWDIHDHDDGILLRLNLTLGTPLQQQLVAELCFSQLSAIGNSLYRGRIEGAEVHFTFPKRFNVTNYQSVLKATVTFGAEYNQLFLPHDILNTPVKNADASDHVVFNMQCEEMLNGLTSADKTTSSVRQLLMESAGEFLSISQVAERLFVSERTLRRRLKSESTNFKAVLEEIRNLLARRYLSQTNMSVTDIAHMLDYAETVNFRRAFRRWNGQIPSQYRLQHAQ